ncbi:MAG: hypothetical protein AAB575_02435 [Patescibacteria group bacterium]
MKRQLSTFKTHFPDNEPTPLPAPSKTTTANAHIGGFYFLNKNIGFKAVVFKIYIMVYQEPNQSSGSWSRCPAPDRSPGEPETR